jgi:hypothetical protein
MSKPKDDTPLTWGRAVERGVQGVMVSEFGFHSGKYTNRSASRPSGRRPGFKKRPRKGSK